MELTDQQKTILNYDGNLTIIASAGCLTGDTVIRLNRCKKGFKSTLKKAYESFNGIAYKGKTRIYDKQFKTYIRSLKNDYIGLNEVKNIIESGVKEVWELGLENGIVLKATPDHKIYTEDREWVELNQLNSKNSVWVDYATKGDFPIIEKTDNKYIKVPDKLVSVGKYHPYAVDHKSKHHKNPQLRIEVHRAMYEAHINKLSLEDFIYYTKVKSDKTLKFINPKEYHIHHKDENHFNNVIENLQCMSVKEHLKLHCKDYRLGGHFPKLVRVKYVKNINRKEMTYDIQCEEPYHNFIANNIVVHNSAKTTTTILKIRKTKEENPDSRILYITFTRKAKQHAIQKLEGVNDVLVTNYHSLAYAVLMGHKKELMIPSIDIVPDSYALDVLKRLYVSDSNKELRSKLQFIDNLKLENIRVDEMSAEHKSVFIQFQEIMDSQRKFRYTDLVYKANDLFYRNMIVPFIAVKLLKFDYIFIDEIQDTNRGQFIFIDNIMNLNTNAKIMAVGDCAGQCLEENTIVGTKKIKDIKIGDEVDSYTRGGIAKRQVINKKMSTWTKGFKVNTKLGYSLTMSPNHKIYATLPYAPKHTWFVYLMYKKEFGFRIGITSLDFKFKYEGMGKVRGRMTTEGATKLWLIRLCEDESEARYYETFYSLKYSIMQAPFKLKKRNMHVTYYEKLFSIYGNNGISLLTDLNMSFDYPNMYSTTHSSEKQYTHPVYRINFVAHGEHHNLRKNSVRFNFCKNVKVYNYLKQYAPMHKVSKDTRNKNGVERYRFLRCFSEYDKASNLIDEITKNAPVDFQVREQLYIPEFKDDNPILILASNLTKYMKVPVNYNGKVVMDEIISIEEVTGTFYDVEVKETKNLFGNNILSHNSIFSWRGGRPDLTVKFINDYSTKVLPLTVNFRSQENIIDFANEILETVDDFPELKKPMDPFKERGGKVKWYAFRSYEAQYQYACRAMHTLAQNGLDYKDMYVMFRNNISGAKFEKAAIKYRLPFKLLKGAFLERKEVQFMLGVIKFADECCKKDYDETYLNYYLKTFAEELAPDIGKKVYNLFYKFKNGMKVLEKLDNVHLLKIDGIGGTRTRAFVEFNNKIKRIKEAYTKYLETKDIPEFLEICKQIVCDFKTITKSTNLEHTSRMESIDELNTIILEREGDLEQRVNEILIDYTAEDKREGDNKVIGMTVHKAKGTENKACFIIDLEEFPAQYSENLNEERRVLYVAVTRAEEQLYLFSNVMDIPFIDVIHRFSKSGNLETNIDTEIRERVIEERACMV